MMIKRHKISGKSIKRKLVKAVLYSRTFTRIRHYRGHGIHSPFVYSLIREAFMKRAICGSDRSLYDALRNCGVGNHSATQLQNLHSYCGYDGFVLLDENTTALPPQRFCVIPPHVEMEKMNELFAALPADNGALAILSPRQSRKRMRMCMDLVKRCKCLTIDNRGYILFFFDRKLPRQHFKL